MGVNSSYCLDHKTRPELKIFSFFPDFQARQNARKRPIEAVDDLVGRKIFEEWKSSKKKKKTVSSEGQWHPQANKEAMEIQRQRVCECETM